MKNNLLSKNYNFKKINEKIYSIWIKNKYFSSKYNKKKKSYYLLLPPPNITGDLHLGHILNFTILDILARFKRMKGYNVCWIPGTDHASIATEIKIINILKKKRINKISKKKLKELLYKWAKKYNIIIIDQLKKIGCSCDWDRFQFTMEKKNYKDVINVFIYLYKKGLIYKKKEIINWDIKAKTTISDEEVIYKKEKNYLYYIKYLTENKKEYLVVATTRPETIFGDTAICINPGDKRYKKFINKKVLVPIINKLVPIITDNSVNKNMGTGCLKITPAHSRKDFNIYKRNKKKIDIINIINDDGTLNENCKNYNGKERLKARKDIYKELKKLGLLIKKKKIISEIGYSERTNTIIEPKVSLQWFLKMKPFIKDTLKNINKIKFYPKKKYTALLYKWLKNIKDWNISRQLTWGHRIPIYYYKNKIILAKNKKEALKKNNIKKKELIKQDPDVLDTWFSSWILPISFLNGINNNNKEFNYYYPIDLLVTGKDILFFWVLRMIMFSLFYKKVIPFKKVYFTGIVRDKYKKKLSKSLGNYKNLYYLLNKYGADGLRISLLSNNYDNDLIFNDTNYIKGRNYINKIWNSFKLIKKIKKIKKYKKKINIGEKKIIKWFYNLLKEKINKINILLKQCKIYKSLILIKKLFKKKFCSIFLEYIKPKKNKINKIIKKKILKFYKILIKILHPYIPFITEFIWSFLYKKKNKSIVKTKFPKLKKKFNKKIIKKFNNTLKFIKKFNKFKCIYINKKNKLSKIIYLKLLYTLNYKNKIKIKKKIIKKKKYRFLNFKKEKIYFIRKKYKINYKNIYKKIIFYKKYLLNIKKKLKNKNFLLYAPKRIIKLEKKKKKDIKDKILNFKEILRN
ncbi:MAG: valine--tRNA ligase [Candidatus Shikimatogenerans bostrichidophilus]|nr:MAG: valine--tRNA ligase [Candidatus Shikimatogenerans bostrichidophilus]